MEGWWWVLMLGEGGGCVGAYGRVVVGAHVRGRGRMCRCLWKGGGGCSCEERMYVGVYGKWIGSGDGWGRNGESGGACWREVVWGRRRCLWEEKLTIILWLCYLISLIQAKLPFISTAKLRTSTGNILLHTVSIAGRWRVVWGREGRDGGTQPSVSMREL